MTAKRATKRKREGDSGRTLSSTKRIIYDFNEMITIVVGEEEEGQRFTVHKDMICAKSKFFRAACSERWASGREKVVRPPEGTPEQFQIHVEWVYTSRINLSASDNADKLDVLIDMYILGDMIDDYQLRNATIKALMGGIQESGDDSTGDQLYIEATTCDQLYRVYEATTAGSPLRQFFVNWVLTCSARDAVQRLITVLPAEFVQELTVAALEQVECLNDKESAKFARAAFQPERDGA